ncbi:MAG: DUF1501 domain-containing protein [Rhodospirillaceae bacterium]|nr:DUF1501 domain-containing protein [Rhodospirillaceae bacterium]
MTLTRRTLLATGSSGAMLTTLAPGLRAAFAADGLGTDRDIFIVVFLRFGADGLTLIPPADDGLYRDNRPTIGIASSGVGAGHPLGALDGVPFFAHPQMPEVKALFDAKDLAIVHAVGLPTDSRSHFVSQELIERGIGLGEKQLTGGWLGRHIVARKLNLGGLGAISTQAEVDVALQGYNGAIAVPDITRFDVIGGELNLRIIEAMNVEAVNGGSEPHIASARTTIDTIRTIKTKLLSLPTVPGNPAGYTNGQLSTSLRALANMIKADVGLDVATVDLGGWDHHANLNQFFGGNARELSRALAAFWTDMKDYRHRITLVTMTEFGRRVQENANGGLDHGAASVMMVLGGNVNGGRVYGRWPGLRPADLDQGDLRVSTDYRQVLLELLAKRRGEITSAAVFPTVPYRPLGVARGDDGAVPRG